MVKRRSKRSSGKRSAGKRSKRSGNTWNIFVSKNYKKLKAQHPKSSFDQLMTKLSKMYKGKRSATTTSRRSGGKKRRSGIKRRSKKYEFNASWAPASSLYA